MATYVKRGTTETIRSLFIDEDDTPITGASPIITIKRNSDDFYYDFNDKTFKAAGWTTRLGTMTEFDATLDPGLYEYDFDIPASGDSYFVKTLLSAASNNLQTEEIVSDGWVDAIRTNREVMLNAVYDENTAVVTAEVWLEIDGEIRANVTNCVVNLYNDSSTLLTTMSKATPDAQGIFVITDSTGGLSADKSYYAVCQLDRLGDTITSVKGLVTID